MDNYSDLFSQHEPDPLLRELNGNILWYWKPMDPNDKRMGCVSNAPFEACDRIKTLERELAEERHSREVAAKHAWRFSDALHKIKDMKPDPEFGMVPIDTAREVARRALEGKE